MSPEPRPNPSVLNDGMYLPRAYLFSRGGMRWPPPFRCSQLSREQDGDWLCYQSWGKEGSMWDLSQEWEGVGQAQTVHLWDLCEGFLRGCKVRRDTRIKWPGLSPQRTVGVGHAGSSGPVQRVFKLHFYNSTNRPANISVTEQIPWAPMFCLLV